MYDILELLDMTVHRIEVEMHFFSVRGGKA